MEDIVLLEHTAPETEAKTSVSVSDFNRDGFDIKSHLACDTLAVVNNWLVVKKTKSWGVLDLMVVDGGKEVRSSFDKFSRDQIVDLFEICLCGVNILRQMQVEKIFVGANINHGFKDQKDAFLRLHLHILGLREGDFAKMRSVRLGDLSLADNKVRELIVDPLLQEFKVSLIDDFTDILKGATEYQFGLRFDLDGFDAEVLADAIGKIDNLIAKKFPSLAYSFCIVSQANKQYLNISPRSVYGKGVLESDGILLRRNKDLRFSRDELEERNKFFAKIINTLSENCSDFKKGKYQIFNNQEVE